MLNFLLPCSVAFAVGLVFSPLLAQACRRLGWIDPPGRHKGHAQAVPFGGFFYVLPFLALFATQGAWEWFWIGNLVLFIGILEDTLKPSGREIPWWVRFLFLTICSLALAFFTEMPPPHWLSLFLLWAALFHFNWMDHSDGLVAAVGCGAFAALAWPGVSELAIPLGLLSAFWVANAWLPSGPVLFIGDAGAQLLGYCLLGWAALYGASSAGTSAFSAPDSWVLLGAVSAVPLLDALRVIGLRLMCGLPPWKPDRERHLGHWLQRRSAPRQLGPAFVAAVTFGLTWVSR